MAYGNTESRRRKQEVFTVKHYGVFDMIGPVMVGPSSSHTAGAARQGQYARHLSGEDKKKAQNKKHGT